MSSSTLPVPADSSVLAPCGQRRVGWGRGPPQPENPGALGGRPHSSRSLSVGSGPRLSGCPEAGSCHSAPTCLYGPTLTLRRVRPSQCPRPGLTSHLMTVYVGCVPWPGPLSSLPHPSGTSVSSVSSSLTWSRQAGGASRAGAQAFPARPAGSPPNHHWPQPPTPRHPGQREPRTFSCQTSGARVGLRWAREGCLELLNLAAAEGASVGGDGSVETPKWGVASGAVHRGTACLRSLRQLQPGCDEGTRTQETGVGSPWAGPDCAAQGQSGSGGRCLVSASLCPSACYERCLSGLVAIVAPPSRVMHTVWWCDWALGSPHLGRVGATYVVGAPALRATPLSQPGCGPALCGQGWRTSEWGFSERCRFSFPFFLKIVFIDFREEETSI